MSLLGKLDEWATTGLDVMREIYNRIDDVHNRLEDLGDLLQDILTAIEDQNKGNSTAKKEKNRGIL